jgi:hypothetical protein
MPSPEEPRAEQSTWLHDDLWGGDNALWRYGRALLAEPKRRDDLVSFLEGSSSPSTPSEGWQQKVADLSLWHRFGEYPLDAQARALALGACQVLLAAAWRLDNRGQFYRHLRDACRRYHDAWNLATGGTPGPLPDPPDPAFEVRELSDADVPGRYLGHLDDAWGERGPAVAMVRSALAGLMPFTGRPGCLLGKVKHSTHLPVLYAAVRGGMGC